MDINALFTDAGLRAFTDHQRDQHMEDARQYGQIADIVKRRLEKTPIDGDRWLSARLRARKVSRQLRAMERASQQAASSAEALYATYVNHVLGLPQRREVTAARKAERKAGRAAATGAAVAKSLHKSAASLNGVQPGDQAGFLDANPYPFPMASGGETQTRSVADFFPREQVR